MSFFCRALLGIAGKGSCCCRMWSSQTAPEDIRLGQGIRQQLPERRTLLYENICTQSGEFFMPSASKISSAPLPWPGSCAQPDALTNSNTGRTMQLQTIVVATHFAFDTNRLGSVPPARQHPRKRIVSDSRLAFRERRLNRLHSSHTASWLGVLDCEDHAIEQLGKIGPGGRAVGNRRNLNAAIITQYINTRLSETSIILFGCQRI